MPLLTIDEMKQRVGELIYRDGWTLEVFLSDLEGPMFHAQGKEPDTTKPGEFIDLDVYSPIPPQVSLESFDLFIQWRLMRIELHESREFLRLKSNGRAIMYPHVECSDRGMYDIERFKEYREESRKMETIV